MNLPRRLGLYGGTFDPIHIGHLLVACAALEELELERLFFIPTAQSPLKQRGPVCGGADRIRLLRLALAGREQFDVDDQEVRRGGISYTIDTVRDYARREPAAELHWLLGSDQVALLPQWRDAAELAERVRFVVVPRPGSAAPRLPPPFRGQELRGWPLALSSSEIRDRIHRRLPIDLLTPAPVVEAIGKNRLYL